MSSLLYQNPLLYEGLLSILHGRSWKSRYELIGRLIGKDKKVLDIGCGSCVLVKYLDQSCEYVGIEANTKFVKYAQKKNLAIIHGDIFELDFPKADVVVLSDILHHVVPKQEDLINKALKVSSMLIICEPVHGKGIGNWISSNKFFFKFFGDNDGVNSYEEMLAWEYTENTLRSFLNKFGKVEIHEVGNSMVASLVR